MINKEKIKDKITHLTLLSNNNFLDWTKFKAFADDKLNVAKIVTYAFDGIENIVGKGENACYKHFLLFLRCFKRLLSYGC